jgi:hypothetical protein
MTTTEKTRKNPDYSKTIINQTNADEVKLELNLYYQLQIESEDLKVKLEITEIFQEWTKANNRLTEQKAKVQEAIDKFGSYQDLDNGSYGLKYNRHSKEYHAQPMLNKFPKEAGIAVEPMVNVDALNGLIKGKILSEDELKEAGVITEKVTEAYYIR